MTRKKSDPPPGSGRYLCVSGDKFGRLTVTCKTVADNSYRHNTYLCRCDCGRVCRARGGALHKGRKRSCGCLRDQARATTGRANRLKSGNATENQMIRTYRNVAKKKGISCTLLKEQFHSLFVGEDPGNRPGAEVKLGDAITEYGKDMVSGYELDVTKLPKDVRFVRFYNSW